MKNKSSDIDVIKQITEGSFLPMKASLNPFEAPNFRRISNPSTTTGELASGIWTTDPADKNKQGFFDAATSVIGDAAIQTVAGTATNLGGRPGSMRTPQRFAGNIGGDLFQRAARGIMGDEWAQANSGKAMATDIGSFLAGDLTTQAAANRVMATQPAQTALNFAKSKATDVVSKIPGAATYSRIAANPVAQFATRWAGPAAAVVGAAQTGYQIGQAIGEVLPPDVIGSVDYASTQHLDDAQRVASQKQTATFVSRQAEVMGQQRQQLEADKAALGNNATPEQIADLNARIRQYQADSSRVNKLISSQNLAQERRAEIAKERADMEAAGAGAGPGFFETLGNAATTVKQAFVGDDWDAKMKANQDLALKKKRQQEADEAKQQTAQIGSPQTVNEYYQRLKQSITPKANKGNLNLNEAWYDWISAVPESLARGANAAGDIAVGVGGLAYHTVAGLAKMTYGGTEAFGTELQKGAQGLAIAGQNASDSLLRNTWVDSAGKAVGIGGFDSLHKEREAREALESEKRQKEMEAQRLAKQQEFRDTVMKPIEAAQAASDKRIEMMRAGYNPYNAEHVAKFEEMKKTKAQTPSTPQLTTTSTPSSATSSSAVSAASTKTATSNIDVQKIMSPIMDILNGKPTTPTSTPSSAVVASPAPTSTPSSATSVATSQSTSPQTATDTSTITQPTRSPLKRGDELQMIRENYYNKLKQKLHEMTERQLEIHTRTGREAARREGLQGPVNFSGMDPNVPKDKIVASIKSSGGGEGPGGLQGLTPETTAPPTERDQSADIFFRKAVMHLMERGVKDELPFEDAVKQARKMLDAHLKDPSLHREFLPSPGETLPPKNTGGYEALAERLKANKKK